MPQADARQVAGLKALQHHIDIPDQPPEDAPTGLRLQVQGDAFLALVYVEKQAALLGVRIILEEGAAPPGRVTPEGLHLDDLSAQTGHEAGAVRPRDSEAQVKNPQGGES